jgi:excisionase family DNA binding protein
MDIPPDVDWLTRKQVAEKFQVTILTVKRWGNEGRITTYKVGRTVRYRREDVEALFQPQNVTAESSE